MNSPLKIDKYELRTGNALRLLRELPDACVQVVVTSPPYYSLRSYHCDPQVLGGDEACDHKWYEETTGNTCGLCGAWQGELGGEPTADLFVEHMVMICREVRRVLRTDGTFFLNIGDTYEKGEIECVPAKLAMALKDDGWFLRQDCIWSKAGGNCPRCHYRLEKGSGIPEPVKNRFVRAHEYVYLLTRSRKYYFDHIAVKSPCSTANRRDVFHIPSQSFRGAHYAVMPLALAELCVAGGASDHGACANCGAPYKRLVKKGKENRSQQLNSGGNREGEYHGKNTKDYENHKAQKASDVKRRILSGMREIITVGWEQTCKCKNPGDPVPCVVMDPFSGAGTTGVAALNRGHSYLGLDLMESNNTEIAGPRLEETLSRLRPPEEIEFLPLKSGIYHGRAEVLIPRVPPDSVRLILTDPPYNTSRANNFQTMNRQGINFSWDGDFDQETWLHLADACLMKGGSIVVWNDWKVLGSIAYTLMDMGYSVKRVLTWRKDNPWPRNTKRSFVQRTEHALWAVKPGGKWVFNKSDDKSFEDGVFNYPVPTSKKGRPRHETKKPDKLFVELVQILSQPGDMILDPFAGGGTTAFAAELTGRRHISFEEAEKWYEESKKHWKDAAHLSSAATDRKKVVAAKIELSPCEPPPRGFKHSVRLKRK